jgi:hypothetical protein
MWDSVVTKSEKSISRRMHMFFDWVTWSIWSIGVLILILWTIETFKEFRALFAEQSENKKKDT